MGGPSERSPRFHRLADWLAWQETLHPNAIDLGLDRLQRTLSRLGWRRPACPVITVAGTNGKGSCVALMARILAEAGYRVGTFTSPHLLRYNERIAIDGVEVSDAALMAAFERIDAARGADTLTFFEFNAAAALLVFAEAELDAVVLEVGLGGRLDAVNVVDADVALVTSIDLDHCDWLGCDRESYRPREGGDLSRRPAGDFRRARHAGVDSRVRRSRSAPICSSSAAISIGDAVASAGSGAGAPASSAICRRRPCMVRSSTTTRPPCWLRWKRWCCGCACPVRDRARSADGDVPRTFSDHAAGPPAAPRMDSGCRSQPRGSAHAGCAARGARRHVADDRGVRRAGRQGRRGHREGSCATRSMHG